MLPQVSTLFLLVLSEIGGERSTGSLEARFECGISKASDLVEEPPIFRGFLDRRSDLVEEDDFWILSSSRRSQSSRKHGFLVSNGQAEGAENW